MLQVGPYVIEQALTYTEGVSQALGNAGRVGSNLGECRDTDTMLGAASMRTPSTPFVMMSIKVRYIHYLCCRIIQMTQLHRQHDRRFNCLQWAA